MTAITRLKRGYKRKLVKKGTPNMRVIGAFHVTKGHRPSLRKRKCTA